MKLLLISILSLLAFSVKAADTNIAVRVTVTIVGISTNQSTLDMLYATAKDKARINGITHAYETARAGGYTNTIDVWYAKVKIKDSADIMANDYNRINSAITLQKLTDLLTINIDLLSAGDLANLATIAAKSP